MKKYNYSLKLSALLAFSLMLSAFSLKAQTYVTGTVTGTVTNGQYYHNQQITIGATAHLVPGSGQSIRYYIAPGCVPFLVQLSPNKNYISTITPRVAGFTDTSQLHNLLTCQAMQSVQYMDGLGRPLQTVQLKGSPAYKDMVQPIAYDSLGRELTKYLPYTVAADSTGKYEGNALKGSSGYSNSAQKTFYGLTGQNYTTIPTPYAQTEPELSPLGRMLEQGAPGNPWQLSASGVSGSGHTVKLDYTTNNTTALTDTANTRLVALYTAAINSNGSHTLARAGSNTATYASGELYVTITKDENWVSGRAGTVEEYKDKDGKVVLKRTFNYKSGALEMLSTYYVYDDLNNLAFVLPPGVSPDAAAAVTQTTLTNFGYQYRYDNRQRLVQKRVPGKGWEFVVYNKLDQPVLTQDSIQRTANQWVVSKYDGLGRVIMTGRWNAGSAIAQATLQDSIYANPQWDNRDYASTTTGYAIGSYPAMLNDVLTISYYDDYSIPNLPAAYDQHSSYSKMTKGLATAGKVAVLNPNGTVSTDMLWNVHYYDDEARAVKTVAQHYLGGTVSVYNYDEMSSTYDFTDAITTTERKHYTKNTGNTAAVLALTVDDSYDYDHMGRKIKTYSQINGGSKVMLNQLAYNEVGQLYNKGLHSANGGSTFLQNIVYGYNERGWMQKDSSALFNMALKYNSPASGAAQYNGNIAQMLYTGPNSGSKTFTYAYDKLNRLSNAASTSGTLDEAMVYDVMGNITSLTRGGQSYSALSYAYTGNQLSGVTGSSFTSRSYAYDGNGNATTDGGTKAINYNMLNLPDSLRQSSSTIATYAYDATGQKLRNTGTDGSWDYISGIVYYNDTLSFVSTEEGRAKRDAANNYTYEYNLKDHLGNDRLSFYSHSGTPTVLQEDEYYSFGLRKNAFGLVNNNRYLYNGKEIQTDLTNQYDYGARFYDPIIGRWTSVDPLAEKSRRFSPYTYGDNNPIRFIDPDGMETTGGPGPTVAPITTITKGLVNLGNAISNWWNSSNTTAGSITQGYQVETGQAVSAGKKETNGTAVVWGLAAGFQGYNMANNMSGAFFSREAPVAAPEESIQSVSASTPEHSAEPVVNQVKTTDLEPTHNITKSKTQMAKLKADIKENGIQEPIKYVENNGTKSVVDGHHRLMIAKQLGHETVPAQQVQLPFLGYRNLMDLIYEHH